jgi:hypothetical protein
MACNKPKCGEKNPCKKCTNDIVVESCDKLCPFILESDCVTVSKDIECGDVKEGDTLTEALEKICGQGGGDNCPCPVSTYTVNSVCSWTKGRINGALVLEGSIDPACQGTYTISLESEDSDGEGAEIQVEVDSNGDIVLIILNPGINYAADDEFTIELSETCTITIFINSVAGISAGVGLEIAGLIFNVTPNFSQSTPTYIDVAFQTQSGQYVVTSTIKNLVPSITEGVSFDFGVGILGLTPIETNEIKSYTFQLIDNLGNYSEPYTIIESDIVGCGLGILEEYSPQLN